MSHVLFAWNSYEACGGVNDWKEEGSLDECKAAFAAMVARDGNDVLGHIVSLSNFSIVCDCYVEAVRAPGKEWYEPADSFTPVFDEVPVRCGYQKQTG